MISKADKSFILDALKMLLSKVGGSSATYKLKKKIREAKKKTKTMTPEERMARDKVVFMSSDYKPTQYVHPRYPIGG